MSQSVRRSLLPLLVAVAAGALPALAQHPTFVPDDSTGIYDVGERVGWTVVLPTGRKKGAAGPYAYTVRRNGGEVITSGMLRAGERRSRIETSLAEPGMLLVEVKPVAPDTTFGDRSTGGPGRVLLAAAVAPTAIGPAEPRPEDFDAFWSAKLEQLAAVPMNPVVTPGASGKPGVEYATVRLGNIDGSHVYGQLARPARPGKLPAMVIYQWASPPYPLQKRWVTDRAAEGWLVLNVEPHDVPGDMPQAFYDALPTLIKRYESIGEHSRDQSYFLRMYLGAYRAVEYLASRPDWNGQTLVATGASMGGQQAFAAAGLNPVVTALVVHVPAGADVTAALHGRAPSYPNWKVERPEVRETARYFDPVNFAPRIRAPALVSMGFIDEVSTPTGIWAVFNHLDGPREAAPMVEAPHNHLATPQQMLVYTRRAAQWFEALVRQSTPPAQPDGGTQK